MITYPDYYVEQMEDGTFAILKPYIPDEHADNPLRNRPQIVCTYPTQADAERELVSLTSLDDDPDEPIDWETVWQKGWPSDSVETKS